MTAGPVAALECGPRSIRLLVATGGPDAGFVALERRAWALGPAPDVDPVLAAVRTALGAHDLGPGAVRAVVRPAAGGPDDLPWRAAVEEAVGTGLEALAPEEGAALALRGATADRGPGEGPFLVVDLGESATEVVYGADTVAAALSLPIGAVRLTDRFVEGDPPRPEELTAAISYSESWVDDVLRDVPQAPSAPTVLVLGATVATVAAVEIGLLEPDRDRVHGFVLTKEAAEDVFRTLATEPAADRIHNPGLDPEALDVIVGGCCALVALYRTLGLDEVVVSDADVLDGVARELVARSQAR